VCSRHVKYIFGIVSIRSKLPSQTRRMVIVTSNNEAHSQVTVDDWQTLVPVKK